VVLDPADEKDELEFIVAGINRFFIQWFSVQECRHFCLAKESAMI
jgi:hypothetical protein